MLSRNNLIDIFKRSLAVTVKSIGKKKDAEINFVTENPSINGKQINLTLPRTSTLKKNYGCDMVIRNPQNIYFMLNEIIDVEYEEI